MDTQAQTPSFGTITGRQRETWALGDYGVVANTIVPVSELLVGAVDPRAGWRVLDVATGTGNTALAAARRHCDVVGVDYVPALLDRARERARSERLDAEFREADAQALPFADGAFDAVLSSFGVMFAPDQERAAAELLRVCRSGGKIGLASWVPDGFGGAVFRAGAAFAPPPPGLKPAARWGTEEGLRELLGGGIGEWRTSRRTATICFRSTAHALEVYRTTFGPVMRAFEAAGPARADDVAAAFHAVFEEHNIATDGTLALAADYLESVALRR